MEAERRDRNQGAGKRSMKKKRTRDAKKMELYAAKKRE